MGWGMELDQLCLHKSQPSFFSLVEITGSPTFRGTGTAPWKVGQIAQSWVAQGSLIE